MHVRFTKALAGMACAATLLAGTPSVAADKPRTDLDPASEALRQLGTSIQRLTLDNGLRVVLNVDQTSPTVAVSVTYDVGSRNEIPGRSGFAHLFEHMMFQGSRNVPKGAHFTLISARGGNLNGTTSTDRTNYFEVLPLNELALALWLEADRMRSLDVSEENFENQRKVVQEEFRMRVANAAYRPAMIRLGELVYQGYWPYAHPTIGSMEDLDAAQFQWVLDFHRSYYAPNNAVLTIAGNFDPKQAEALVRRYFADIPKQTGVPPFVPPPRPIPRKGQSVERVADVNAKTPAVFYGWLIPDTLEPDHYALELASTLLTDGESAILHQDLVRSRAWAREVTSWTYDRRGPDSFVLSVLLTHDAELPLVRKELEAALETLAEKPISSEQLERVRNRVRSYFLFRIQSNLDRAAQLGEYETFFGDAGLLTRQLDHYLAVTPADIQSAVARYLGADTATVVEVVPGHSSDAQEKAQ